MIASRQWKKTIIWKPVKFVSNCKTNKLWVLCVLLCYFSRIILRIQLIFNGLLIGAVFDPTEFREYRIQF